MRAYNSPFKPPKLSWYFGKVAIGTPYFLPRKWVNLTEEEAIARATSLMSKGIHGYKDIPFEKLVQSCRGYQKHIPKLFGLDFVELGWKTKWTDTDIRFEFSPRWSLVLFKWQIAVTFVAPEENHYWECWLYYTRHTDKTKSTIERLKQARKEFSCVWRTYANNEEIERCYWDTVLKKKWL